MRHLPPQSSFILTGFTLIRLKAESQWISKQRSPLLPAALTASGSITPDMPGISG
jgi:hypothetical protein